MIPTLRMLRMVGVSACLCAGLGQAGCSSAPTRDAAPGVLEAGALTPRDAVLHVEAWTFEGIRGRAITTASFRVYTTSPDSLTIARLPAFLEGALTHYRSELAALPAPGARMETYMMPTRPQWERLTRRLLGDKAGPYLRIVRGGFAAGGRGVYFDIGPRDSLLIAAHEGWHQYAQTTFKGAMPVWLDEGVAAYMEGFRWDPAQPDRAIFLAWSNPERFDRLRDAARTGRLLPLSELLSTTPQRQIRHGSSQILTYYAQLWALIHFLHEGEGRRHAPALSRLLRDAASGRVENVLISSLGRDRAANAMKGRTGADVLLVYFAAPGEPGAIERLDLEYRRFVRDITRPGARNDVIAGRSPVSSPVSSRAPRSAPPR